MDPNTLATGFLWFLAFLFSTTVHEAMHALAAWRGGDPTAYHGGQVSLSPIPHIRREPIGMLVVPLLTALSQGWAIGWASTPYDPRWAARYPKRSALMAAAGPAGNLLIAFVALVLIKVGLATGLFVAPIGSASSTSSPRRTRRSFTGGNSFDLPDAQRPALRVQPDSAAPARWRHRHRSVHPGQRHLEAARAESPPMFQLAGLLIAWQIFPSIVGPLFALILKAVHPSLSYS